MYKISSFTDFFTTMKRSGMGIFMAGRKHKNAITEILRSTFLFDGISSDEICVIMDKISHEEKTYQKDEIIFSPEHFERVLGVVLSGKISVKKGRLSVSELQKGSLFGAAALFNNEPEYASTLTAKGTTAVLFFSQDTIQLLINQYEQIRMNYICYLSERIRFLSEKVDTLGEISTEKKLARFLLKNAVDGHVYGCTFSEIAERLGIGRASLYRELTKFEEAGIIKKNRHDVEILKPEELSHVFFTA